MTSHGIQHDVRAALLARCDNAADVDTVLDLGCGTGSALERLRAHYRGAQVIGADLAEGMLQVARARHGGALWLAADAERLPLPDSSVDRMVSSLAVQWCESLDWLVEMYRVLAPGWARVRRDAGQRHAGRVVSGLVRGRSVARACQCICVDTGAGMRGESTAMGAC